MLTKAVPILLCLFLTFSQKTFSNTNYIPGYYIANTGDTVICEIEYKDWYHNPERILVQEKGAQKSFGPNDIRGFGATGYPDYQSANISYHPGPIQGNDLPKEFSDKVDTQVCFLRVLVNGPYSLFELSLAERSYLFASQPGTSPKELVYRVKQVDMEVVPDEQYKNVLADFCLKEGIGDQESGTIRKLTYSRIGLTSLVNRLNEARTGHKTIVIAKPGERTRILQVDIFGAALFQTYPSGFFTKFGSATLPSSFSPAGGISLHFVFPAHFNAFSLGIGAGYSTFQSRTTNSGGKRAGVLSNSWYDSAYYKETVSVSNAQLMTKIYVMYLFKPSGKLQFYAKAAADLDFLLKPQGNLYTEWSADYIAYHSTNPPYPDGSYSAKTPLITFAKSAFGAEIAAGCQLGRSKLEVIYKLPVELADDTQPTFKLNTLGLYYYYTVFK